MARSLRERAHAATEAGLRDQCALLEAEWRQHQTAAASARQRADAQLLDRDAQLLKAHAALELKTRQAEADAEARGSAVAARVEAERRTLQQRFQLELESKLADLRAGYETRLAVERTREVAAREQAEQRVREIEAQGAEAKQVCIPGGGVGGVRAGRGRERRGGKRRDIFARIREASKLDLFEYCSAARFEFAIFGIFFSVFCRFLDFAAAQSDPLLVFARQRPLVMVPHANQHTSHNSLCPLFVPSLTRYVPSSTPL